MCTSHPPDTIQLDLDDLIARIREEAKRRQGGTSTHVAEEETPSFAFTPVLEPRFLVGSFSRKSSLGLRDFLSVPDEAFLDFAYRAVLKREPDEAGIATYGKILRKGRNRAFVLASLLWSEEAEQHRESVRGLGWTALFKPLRGKRFLKPVLGVQESLARGLDPGLGVAAELNLLRGDLDKSHLALREALSERESYVSQLSSRLENLRREKTDMAHRTDELHTHHTGLKAQLDRLELGIDGLGARTDVVEQHMDKSLAALNEAKRERDMLMSEVNSRLVGLQRDGAETACHTGVLREHYNGLTAQAERLASEIEGLDSRTGVVESRTQALETAKVDLAQESAALVDRLGSLETAKIDLARETTALTDRLDRETTALAGRLGRLTRDLDFSRSDLIYHRTQLHDVLKALSADFEKQDTTSTAPSGEEAVHSEPKGNSVQAVLRSGKDDHLQAYYVAFEDAFRGEEQAIQDSLTHYLKDVASAGTSIQDTWILDLGCGRGEWLRLLQEHGMIAAGADNNAVMVDHCRERGLEVHRIDAIDFLRQREDGSAGAVSAFHLIEHLPFTVLYELLEQAHRVLSPGGLLLLETPNPENLLVGSHTFYHDPTHRNPMTPTATAFMVRYFGFEEPEIRRLHPYPQEAKVPGNDPLTERVNGHLCGPQDFAIIARKPDAAA